MPLLNGCSRMFTRFYEVTPACFAQVSEGPICFALCMGLLSIWWHPKLRQKVEKRYGKLAGLSDYYKMQVLTLAVQCLAWYWITRTGLPDARLDRAVHLFMIIFNVVSIFSSYRAITMDYTPKVSFKESPEALIPHRNRVIANIEVDKPPSLESLHARGRQPMLQPRPFSINDLAPPTSQPSAPRLPTPPPEADYDDHEAMDWTPSQTPLRPANTTRILPAPFQQRQQEESSPFHGALPASIVSPAHRLRNPPNQPIFRAVSAANKQSFFCKPTPAFKTAKSDSLGPSVASRHMDDESPTHTIFPDPPPAKFEKPRFFPQSDYQTDTGLEGLLAKAFTLDEAPAEVHAAQQHQHQQLVTRREAQQQQQAFFGRQTIWTSLSLLLVVTLLGGFLCVKAWEYLVRDTRDVGGVLLMDASMGHATGLVRQFLAI
ncbi:MAG: hypothetical protein Q9217_006392 [Psora testacea]